MNGNTLHTFSLTEHIGPAPRDQLRTLAGQIVGRVFYGQVLQGLRASRISGPYGHGGRGEEVFQTMLDGVLAERMGSTGGGTFAAALERAYGRQADAITVTRPTPDALSQTGAATPDSQATGKTGPSQPSEDR